MPLLSADPAAETNHLLRLLVQGSDNATLTAANLTPAPFVPTKHGIRINTLISFSLSLSLFASFGALLGQQWIMCFQRPSEHVSGSHRWQIARQIYGAKIYGLQSVLEVFLTTLLQVALLIFMGAGIMFLWDLNHSVALPNIILISFAASLSLISFAVALWDPLCPYQTPLSIYLIWNFPVLKRWFLRRRTTLHEVGTNLSPVSGPKIRRAPSSEEFLTAEFVRRVLWDSSDEELLHLVARNLPLFVHFKGLRLIYNSLYSVDRLLSRIKSTQDNSERLRYSSALCHLVLMAHSSRSERRKENLIRYQGVFGWTAKVHAENSSKPRSLLPSSIATVAIIPLQSSHIFLLRALASAPDSTFAIGISAWALLFSEDYTLPQERNQVLSGLGFYPSIDQGFDWHTRVFNAAVATQALSDVGS